MVKNKVEVTVVTPEKEFYSASVDQLSFKTTEGDMGVLFDHIPVIATLASGIAVFKIGKDVYEAVLHNGFAEVGEESVNILTDAAEWADEIDMDRAKSAKERAENRLEEMTQPKEVVIQSEASLQRAIARIEAVQKLQK